MTPEEVTKLAAEFVAAFGPGVHSNPKLQGSHHMIELLEGDSGRGICISVQNADRYSVSLTWPWSTVVKCGFRPENPPEITISRKRSIPDVVKDIQRRLLPGYAELFAEFKAKADKADEQATAQKQALKRLCDIVGERWNDDKQDQITAYKHCLRMIRVNHDGTKAELQITPCPIAVIEEILNILAKKTAE